MKELAWTLAQELERLKIEELIMLKKGLYFLWAIFFQRWM